mgnify:CR=1 FL=1
MLAAYYDEIAAYLGNGLLTSRGPRWRQQRRTVAVPAQGVGQPPVLSGSVMDLERLPRPRVGHAERELVVVELLESVGRLEPGELAHGREYTPT